MSQTTSSWVFEAPDTLRLEASDYSAQNLAAEDKSASTALRTQMDVDLDTITALHGQRPLSPAPTVPEPTGTSQEPLSEKPKSDSPAAATVQPKVPNEEFAEDFKSGDKLMPIAIVGMGCRFPQDATNPENLFDMILRKQSACTDIPSDRFNVDAFYHPDTDRNGTISNRGGYFLKQDVAAFDAPFFSISPTEAKSMDPMQRILLEVVYEATENAGISMDTLAGSDTSCYVGCFTDDYNVLLNRDIEKSPTYHSVGVGRAILSNRISFFFDLKGPSMTLDTACSSSLVAIHLACQSLRTGESKAAIIGATNAILSPEMQIGMTNLHFLSPDSICYTFDERANGYARGEGMAALILKPLDDAIRDGNTIRAVIRGTASNQDGKTAGIMLPSKSAQERLIRDAYEQAGCDPSITGYFEAHGTGTRAGDPIEASAIGATLGQHRQEGEEGKLYLGSVETNIGHLEGASGLAGLIKTVLSLERGIILPNLWFEKGNPTIDFDGWRIRVPTEPVPWPVPGLRRASINSFGYGGTNGHTIIDDAYHYLRLRDLNGKHCTSPTPIQLSRNLVGSNEVTEEVTTLLQRSKSRSDLSSGYNTDSSWENMFQKRTQRPRIFHLAAHEEGVAAASALTYAAHLASRVDENEDGFLDDLAYTLCERRSRLPWGCFVVAATKKEVVEKLMAPSLKPIRRFRDTPRLAFVFTGQGAQWWRMGRELLMYPVFASTLEKADEAVKNLGAAWSLFEELNRDEDDSRVNEATISQPLCTALQMALVSLYASWNVHPRKVIGHSSGEIAAAYTIGALSIESAMQVAYFRGMYSSKLKEYGYRGAMMAAGISEGEANQRIMALGGKSSKVVVACVNSPVSVTLSGDETAIMELQKALDKDMVFARRLKIDTAYHSHHMLSVSESYRRSLSDLKVTPTGERNSTEMISSVTGQPVVDQKLDVDYWVDNMTSRVQFSAALTNACTQSKSNKGRRKVANKGAVDILIELGPHSALAGPVKQVLAGVVVLTRAKILYHSALIRGSDASATALEVAASLFARGYPLDMHTVQFPDHLQACPSVVVDLPTYSWNHSKKYWSESRLSLDYRLRRFPRNDVLGAQAPDWNPIEPTWRNFIRLSEQPWVKNHQVQDTIVYPAAGYISMALEAAMQTSTLSLTAKGNIHEAISRYTIRELSISRALVVPQTEDGVETIFSMRPHATSSIVSSDTWKEFRIFSHTPSGGWNEHCRGLISVIYEHNTNEVDENQEENKIVKQCHAQWEAAKITCTSKNDCAMLYEDLAASGLYYGPEFRNMIEVATGGGKALGTVQIPDTRSMMPGEFEFEHLLHPVTMDSFLHMIVPALFQGDTKSVKDPYVPTFVQEINFSAGMSTKTGHRFQVVSEAKHQGFRDALATIIVLDEASLVPLIRIDGAICTALAVSRSTTGVDPSENGPRKLFNSLIWEPDVDMLTKPQLDEILRDSLGDKNQPPSVKVADYEMLAHYFFDQVLKEMKDEEVVSMLEHHQKFFRFIQNQHKTVLAGKHEYQTPEWMKLDEPQVAAKIARLIHEQSVGDNAEGRMFVRMGQALTSVLRQKIDPLVLMMEGNLLHDYYATGLGVSMTYVELERYITLLSHKYPDLDYLEIGAGTGGATVPTLRALSSIDKHKYPRLKSYTYTDISSGFFEAAGKKFSDWRDLMKFRKLDIGQNSDQQGFENQRYDVILAANVVHATYDIYLTLANVRRLLKPGGKLILLEITHALSWISLLFGNLSGWWMSVEPWRQCGPLLEENKWREALQETGFTDLQASVPDMLDPLEHMTRVMVATAAEEVEMDRPQSIPVPLQVVIVCPESRAETTQDLASAAQRTLESQGVSTEISYLSRLSSTDLNGKIGISFVELEDSLLTNILPADFTALQRLTQELAGLLWITRGGTPDGIRPELSLFQGLARSIRSEQETFPCITIDLDPKETLPIDAALKLIIDVFQLNFVPGKAYTVLDREFSEKGGFLRIKRVVEDDTINKHIAARTGTTLLPPEPQPVCQPGRPLKLVIGDSGTLNSLFFTENPAICEPIPDDNVEIEVQSVGLNARDVLIWKGEISDKNLGIECAGVVTKVGAAVRHLLVGDRVNALCMGSFSTSVRSLADYVQRIPDSMSFAIAASLPLIYITAYYGLVSRAQLLSGESVLIHAAAGGVGQAAIQIAKMIGAEIFVTVGTKEKKEHLKTAYGISEDHIFASRDLSFAGGIMRVTGGRGVDVVLNSLAGDALNATWRCIAPFGRFIEVGKRYFETNMKLDMAPFMRNVTFASIEVTAIVLQNRKLAADLFLQIMKLVRSGSVKEISPVTAYPFSQIEDSFCLMQAGKHMGKIVLEPRVTDLVQGMPQPSKGITFPSDASYLLAGGLGGLGRSISDWMVSNGARNLIYVSRSGASSPEARNFVNRLIAAGIRIQVLTCDIADEQELSASLHSILKLMPPIRGVVQGAMVLKDQVFSNMSFETFMNTLRPKVQGSWSLHKATLNQPLDFFVLMSSAASAIGNAGQSNYVAACTYQVALAAHRVSQGLPATAIDIGKVADVGYVAENAGTVSEQNLVRMGMLDIKEEELLAMVELAMMPQRYGMTNGYMLTGIDMAIETSSGEQNMPFWSRDPVFSHIESFRPHLAKSARSENIEGSSQISLPTLLGSAASLSEAITCVLNTLVRKFSRSLMMAVEDIDVGKSTAAYGMDSLIAVEIRNWIFREAKADIPVFEILQAVTLTALAQKVTEKSALLSQKLKDED